MSDDAAADGAEKPQGYAAAAARGSAWMTIQTVLNKLATIAAGLVLARLLTPDDYGIASFVVQVAVFAFVVPPFVMGDVLLAERERFNQIAGAANLVMWAAGLAMFGLIAALAVPFERMEGIAGLALIAVVAATRPLADALVATPYARVRIDLDYRRMAFVDGGVMLAATIGSVAMAYFGAGPLTLVAPPIAVLAVRGAIYWRMVAGKIDLTVRAAEIVRISRRFLVAGLGQYVNNILLALEIVVLGIATNKTEVGLFNFAASYAIQANAIIASQIGLVLQPIFAHVQGDPARQIGGFLRATRLLSAVAVPLSLIQAAIAIPAFRLLFPPQWTGSIAIFATLSVAQAFVFVSTPSIALLKAQGRFRAYLYLQLAQLVTAVAAFLLAVGFGGPLALRLADAVGLPTDPDAGQAVALGVASAVVWAAFCPPAVWLATRPARTGIGTVIRVFFEPWIVAVPAAAVLVACWLGLESTVSTHTADIVTVVVCGPVVAVAAIIGCVAIRAETRADAWSIVGRFRLRGRGGA